MRPRCCGAVQPLQYGIGVTRLGTRRIWGIRICGIGIRGSAIDGRYKDTSDSSTPKIAAKRKIASVGGMRDTDIVSNMGAPDVRRKTGPR